MNDILSLNPAAWGVSADHGAGLLALILSPVIVWLIVRAIHVGAWIGVPGARRIVARYSAAPVSLRTVAWLMLTSAVVHLALVPHHWSEGETSIANLFVLDGIALTLGAALLFRSRRWRWGAAGLLIANLFAYMIVIGDHQEAVDQLGVTTKLVELTALGFLLVPHRQTREMTVRRRRWVGAAASFLLIFATISTVIWGVQLDSAEAGAGGGHHAMVSADGHDHAAQSDHTHNQGEVMVGDTASPPTTAQIAAAAELAEATRRALAKYEDVEVALAAGYKPEDPPLGPANHYQHPDRENDGHILDPDYPETLVYVATANGPLLLGAMYSMPGLQRDAPAPGGSLTPWHVHANVCFGPLPPHFIGLLTPFGTCPALSFNIVSNAMIHVWTVDWSGGPYGEMTDEDINAIVAAHGGE